MSKSAAASAFTYRCLQLLSQGICTLIAPLFLSEELLGYYFTMLSLASAQSLFELGFGQTLISFYTKYIALSPSSTTRPSNELSLLHVASRYVYLFIALSFFVIGGAGGYLLLGQGPIAPSLWQGQWLILLSCVSLNFFVNRKLIYVESTGRVSTAYTIRTIQILCGFIAFSLISLTIGGLWIACAFPISSILVGYVYLMRLRFTKHHLRTLHSPYREILKFYFANIFQFQLKVSGSFICGFLGLQLFLPLIFHLFGPYAAGRLGLSLSIMSGIVLLASSYASSNAHHFALLASKSLFDESIRLLYKSITISLCICLVILIPINILVALDLQVLSSWPISTPGQFVLLSTACASNSIIYCCAIYLRSFLTEPMLKPSLFGVLVMYALLFSIGKSNLYLAIFSYSLSSIAVLCIALYIILNRTIHLSTR